MRTSVTARGQTLVPVPIRKGHRIGPHTELEWIDDGETIRIVPIPKDVVQAAKGVSKGLGKKLLEERYSERRRA
jgi:bifunctional DNA-binding transcriptional regulator/antitoxin component of YhaV-PrlF toxin-antitoxin module